MKKLFLLCFFSLLFAPLFGDVQDSANVEYDTYTDPGLLYQVKYPKEIFSPASNGEFARNNQESFPVYFEIHAESVDENRTWEREYDYRQTVFLGDETKKITYKVFKKNFFVFSGSFNDWIFYKKEIPFENDGKRFVLYFEMKFPKKDKEKWDPILTVCADSLSLCKTSNGNKRSLGWAENSEDFLENNLVRKAKKWVEANLKCEQSAFEGDKASDDKSSLGKCFVDEKNIPFFNLKASPARQFLLSVHGPITEGRFFHGDYKYVLFTFASQKLTGEVLHKIQEGELPGGGEFPGDPVEIINAPGKVTLLALEIGSYGGRGSSALVFRDVREKIKNVLDYQDYADESKPGQGDGMESLLLPQPNGDLRIFWHRWERDVSKDNGDSDATLDRYSEVFFHFDSDQEKYLPIGTEKELPSTSASAEWNNLTN